MELRSGDCWLPAEESVSKMQTRGCSMSLKSGVALHLGQGGVNSVQVSQLQRRQSIPRPEYFHHHVSLWV